MYIMSYIIAIAVILGFIELIIKAYSFIEAFAQSQPLLALLFMIVTVFVDIFACLKGKYEREIAYLKGRVRREIIGD